MTNSGEISLIEVNETSNRESNDLHRIDLVTKLKRNVLPCLAEEIIMELTKSKAKYCMKADGIATAYFHEKSCRKIENKKLLDLQFSSHGFKKTKGHLYNLNGSWVCMDYHLFEDFCPTTISQIVKLKSNHQILLHPTYARLYVINRFQKLLL